jgi:hypothetical protein
VYVGAVDAVVGSVAEGSTATDMAVGSGPHAASRKRLVRITMLLAKNGEVILISLHVATGSPER